MRAGLLWLAVAGTVLLAWSTALADPPSSCPVHVQSKDHVTFASPSEGSNKGGRGRDDNNGDDNGDNDDGAEGEADEAWHSEASEGPLRAHLAPYVSAFMRTGGVPVHSVVRRGVACLDGRVSEELPMVEGGDLGVFILTLHSLLAPEHHHHQQQPEEQQPDQDGRAARRSGLEPLRFGKGDAVTQDAVDGLLVRYVEMLKDEFVMCMSDMALARLCTNSGYCERDITVPPPPNAVDKLLLMLSQPLHIGDDVLRLAVGVPDAFPMLHPELVALAIRSVYRVVWGVVAPPSHGTLRVLMLTGSQFSNGLVDLTSPPCNGQETVLLVNPRAPPSSTRWHGYDDHGYSPRFRHPAVAAALFRHAAAFAAESGHVKYDSRRMAHHAARCVSDERAADGVNAGTSCVFPFVFQDTTFTDCAPSEGHDFGWCATSRVWEATDSWGYCSPPNEACKAEESEGNDIQQHVTNQITELSTEMVEAALLQFAIDLGGTQYVGGQRVHRPYPYFAADLADLCCPAASAPAPEHVVVKATVEPTVQSRLCAGNSVHVGVHPATSTAPGYYPVDALMPKEILEHFQVTTVSPFAFSSPQGSRVLPMDGRLRTHGVYSPGGAVAELAAVLAAFGSASPVDIASNEEVRALVVSFVSNMSSGRFVIGLDYDIFGTVVAAVARKDSRLLQRLQAMDNEERRDHMLALAQLPPAELREPLLDALSSREVVLGDTFLRFVMTLGEGRTRQEHKLLAHAIRKVIRAVLYTLWFDNDEGLRGKFEVVLIEGPHLERAMVRAVVDDKACQVDHSPLLSPRQAALNSFRQRDTELWLYHPNGPALFRKEASEAVAGALLEQSSTERAVDAGKLLDDLAVLFAADSDLRLPFYNLAFEQSCCVPL